MARSIASSTSFSSTISTPYFQIIIRTIDDDYRRLGANVPHCWLASPIPPIAIRSRSLSRSQASLASPASVSVASAPPHPQSNCPQLPNADCIPLLIPSSILVSFASLPASSLSHTIPLPNHAPKAQDIASALRARDQARVAISTPNSGDVNDNIGPDKLNLEQRHELCVTLSLFSGLYGRRYTSDQSISTHLQHPHPHQSLLSDSAPARL